MNEPKLRFPEFTDDWKSYKFGDIFTVSQGLQIPIDKRFLKDGENRFFYITNEFLKDTCGTAYYIENPSPSVLCNNEDILMTRTGNTGIVVTNVSGCFHNNFFKIKYDNHNFSKNYIYYLLNTKRMQNTILKNAGSSTIPDLSHKSFYQITGCFPKQLREQEKIGSLLLDVDNLIQSAEKELEGYRELKQGMLQKMFPKNGEATPEIRFPEFTGDWKQHKFEDVITIGSGKDYKHLESGNVPVYGTGGYMLSVNQALSENEDAVGIGRKGTIDKPYILRAPFWTVDTLFYCIPNKGFDLTFTNCLFQNVDWKRKDESTGVPSLSKVIINNVKTYVPSLEEQKKIGVYFQNLDSLIASQQQEIEGYKELKKGLLQQMFC